MASLDTSVISQSVPNGIKPFPSELSPSLTMAAGPQKRKQKIRTREKIEKLVEQGAKNYPAYLKLIYTGDSEHSSEDEPGTAVDNKLKTRDRLHPEAILTISGKSPVRSVKKLGCGVTSPESNKLLDPGREKMPTPTVENNHIGSSYYADEDTAQTASEQPEEDVQHCNSTSCEKTQAKSNTRNRSEPVEDFDRESWHLELLKLQDDIVTLKTLLRAKTQVAADLKQKLGITPMNELRHDLHYSIQSIKESSTYQKTNAVFKSFGAFASKKFGNIRNSNVFKSTDEKARSNETRHNGMASRSENDVSSMVEYMFDTEDEEDEEDDEEDDDEYYDNEENEEIEEEYNINHD